MFIALPASTFCICKHLEFIASGRPIALDKRRWRRIYFEAFMCIVLPCIWMFMCTSDSFTFCSNIANPGGSVYCFQPARYVIVEDFGCFSAIWPSYVLAFILFVPPLSLAVATLVYGGEQALCDNLDFTCLIYSPATAIALYHLIQNHRTKTKTLTPHLASRNSCLSSSHYCRLMAMSMVIGIWGVVCVSLLLSYVFELGAVPLPSWHELHKGDSTVIKLTLVDLSPAGLTTIRSFRWGIPGAAFIFFVLFGASNDVFSEYTRPWTWFGTTVLRRRLPAKERSMSTLRSG